MKTLTDFVQQHLTDDVSRLILDKGKWPEIDMNLAVNCIESRRKLKGKVQEWHDNPDLIFPAKLSAEQCSSSLTAAHKAKLASSIYADDCGFRIADITGGLGVDSWFFSRKASEVLYNEMQPELAAAAEHNFKVLGAENIKVCNICITDGREKEIREFRPDIIYIDPARRGEGGRKVFLIEDCTPDILSLKETLFEIARYIFVKLSPMADITMACQRLGSTCKEVNVISAYGECKELLILMDREWNGEYTITATELHNDGTVSDFRFHASEEKESAGIYLQKGITAENISGMYLFEPGKSLMKSGAFNLMAERFGTWKMGISTHYYLTDDAAKAQVMKSYGKVYKVISCAPLDKKSMKAAAAAYPLAEVTARNIPMNSDALRKKMGVSSGGHAHIFGLKSDSLGNLLIVSERI